MNNKSGTSRGTPTQILVETTVTATTETRAALGNPEVIFEKGSFDRKGF